MNKTIRILYAICAISWTAALVLAILKPDIDYRIFFIVAAAVLAIQNIVEFICRND